MRGGNNRRSVSGIGPWLARVAAALALGAALAGCGDGDDPAPEPTTIAAPSPAAVAAGTPVVAASPAGTTAAGLGAVVWTAAVDPATKAPLEPVTRFAADAPALYAALPVARIAAGTTLTAAWTYNRTPVEGVAGTVTATAAAEETWVEFHLTLVAGQTWPEGTYEIEVAVDGLAAQAAAVEVGTGL